ncbi:MAG: site-2 protease family protein [Oscillospiraceae bacterium]|nr:site-2 protease family protein [Oscillospiraceae bacterium]
MLILQIVRGLNTEQAPQLLIHLAALVAGWLLSLSVHEFAHAWAAKKLGDNTAQMQGRLTLDPFKHLDLMGTLMIFIIGVGWAKPVPVNPRNLEYRRFKRRGQQKCMALVAAAGPLSNLIQVFVFAIFTWVAVVLHLLVFDSSEISELVALFFSQLAFFNVMLMVFNLLPVPPLDGSRIVDIFLPPRASLWMYNNERTIGYIFLAAIVLLGWMGVSLISWATTPIFNGIMWLVGLPFRLILGG